MSHQKVRNVMSTDVPTARKGTSFKDVARILASWDMSALPVVDQDRRVLGVVSAADLLVKQGRQELSSPAHYSSGGANGVTVGARPRPRPPS
jgi:CBS-domain-containing membrane protein